MVFSQNSATFPSSLERVLGSPQVEGQVAQLRIWSLIRSFPGRDSGSNLPVPRVTPRDYLHLHPDYQFDATGAFSSHQVTQVMELIHWKTS